MKIKLLLTILVFNFCYSQFKIDHPIRYEVSPNLNYLLYCISLDSLGYFEEGPKPIKVILKNLENGSEKILEKQIMLNIFDNDGIFWIDDSLIFYGVPKILNIITDKYLELKIPNAYEYIRVDPKSQDYVYIKFDDFSAKLKMIQSSPKRTKSSQHICNLVRFFEESGYKPDIELEWYNHGNLVYFHDYNLNNLTIYKYNLISNNLVKFIEKYNFEKGQSLKFIFTDNSYGIYSYDKKEMTVLKLKTNQKNIVSNVDNAVLYKDYIYWQANGKIYSNEIDNKIIYDNIPTEMVIEKMSDKEIVFVKKTGNYQDYYHKKRPYSITVKKELIDK